MLSRRATAQFLMALAILLPLGAAVETIIIGPELPERIATHFDWSGRADGWMSKRAAFLVTGSVCLFVVLPLACVPLLFRWLPDSRINLPHREHWLSAEHREETREYLAAWCAAFAAGTSGFAAWTQHLLLKANLAVEHPHLDPSFGWALGAYFLLAVLGTFALFAHFRRPREQQSPVT